MVASEDLSEADIVFNRASLALAKSQRVIASWLPARIQHEAAATMTEEELDKEETEIFSPVPETLGLGAPVPRDGEGRSHRAGHQSSSSEERLRKQLFGKQASRSRFNYMRESDQRSDQPTSTKSKLQVRNGSVDSEDEQGRTASTENHSKTIRNRRDPEEPRTIPGRAAAGVDCSQMGRLASHTKHSKKRPSSYLDEVLLARSEKRKKKERARHTSA